MTATLRGGFIVSIIIALAWPGVALYDTVLQFTQMRSGHYDDWHPPVMARLWSVFDAIGLIGTAPLFVVQVGLFIGGLTLITAALPRLRPAALAVAGIALIIPTDWMTVVVKDAQMVASLAAATGIVAAYRLRGRAMPGAAILAVGTLLTYAVLLRANAVFAVAPLVFAWTGWFGVRHITLNVPSLAAATLAVIAVSPVINHRILGASVSHVERVLPVYDLAGIAHFDGPVPPRVDPAAWRAADARGCYSSYLWDALGDDSRCGFVAEALGRGGPAGDHLIGEWVRTIAAHPLAYARHRAAHLNATLRFIVPYGQPNAGAPPDSQPNQLGLGGGGTWRTRLPAAITRGVMATPFGWPAVWLAASLGLWATAAATPRSPPRDLALALALSAGLMTLSFAVVSIASDLRYHLWAIVATILAAVLLTTCPGVSRRGVVATATAVALIAAIGTVARLILPMGAWG